MKPVRNLTPKMVVEELDRYIIGQHKAKRAVAIAMRNRWRRQMVDESIRDEISPKNIIMVGPTGVGKTEIARRLARLTGAPFLKVEVSKFTEVGYVGRDVDAIIRDLIEVGAQLVREELRKEVRDKAGDRAEERILDLLLPPASGDTPRAYTDRPEETAAAKPASGTREKLRELLRAGKLDAREIEIEVEASAGPGFNVPPGMGGNEQVGQQLKDLFGQLGRRSHKRTVQVADARELLVEEEAAKLVDADTVARRAVERCEQLGVVFLDEIDKICGRENMRGADISREGVQRDLLPLVEGSTVQTKYGPVKSDHILFVAAGAFHVSKVSDLIPELQGRFPIRVELDSLSGKDFARILREPANSLLKQYAALMATEEVTLSFEDDAIEAMAELAFKANTMLENIGARRLHTVLERVLEDLSFEASELGPRAISISAADVHERVDALLTDQDLSRHIL